MAAICARGPSTGVGRLDALDAPTLACLTPGETLLLSGRMFTGRDAAHKRMIETLRAGGALPVDLRGRAIYYVGPVDPIPGEVIGPAGPTTSNRMDKFTDELLDASGLKIMIGKAERGTEAIEAIRRAWRGLHDRGRRRGLSGVTGDPLRASGRLR